MDQNSAPVPSDPQERFPTSTDPISSGVQPAPDGDPPARRAPSWGTRLATLGAIASLLCFIGSTLPRLLTELHAFRAEQKAARLNAPVGWLNIAPRITYARPQRMIQRNGARVELWADTLPGVGPVWFDVSNMTVPLASFGHGIGRDTIHPIDAPIWVGPREEHARRFQPEFRVLGIIVDGQAYAYPVMLMRRVEVVNQREGGRMRIVTFSALSSHAGIYEGELDGQALSLGSSGWTCQNAFVLYDRATQSLWSPRPEGLLAIAGARKGRLLRLLETPTQVEWSEWLHEHPETRLLIGAERKPGIPGK